jgi:signal transduction histidine kinase
MNSNEELSSIASSLQKKLNQKQNKIEKIALQYRQMLSPIELWDDSFRTNWDKLYLEEGLALFLYSNDSLSFWSANNIPLPTTMEDSTFKTPILKLKNGWYKITAENFSLNGKDFTLLKTVLIKNEYSYENKYLSNEFHHSFGIRDKINIISDNIISSVPVFSDQNEYLFSIQNESGYEFKNHKPISSILFFISILIVLQLLWLIIKRLFQKYSQEVAFAIHAMLLIFLRYFMMTYQFPDLLYQFPFFDPTVYADSFFLPSLGDMFLNTLVLLHTCYLFYKHFNLLNLFAGFHKRWIYVSGILLVHALTLFYFFVTYLSKSLVLNSTISLNPEHILNFSIFSGIALISISLLILSLFLVSDKIISTITQLISKPGEWLLIISTILFWLISPGHHYFRTACIFVIVCSIAYIKTRAFNSYTLSRGLLLLMLYSMLFARVISTANTRKEKDQRLYLAQQLIIERDYHAEYLFNNAKTSILNDGIIWKMTSDENVNIEEIQKYLLRHYFDEWKKYELQLTICHPLDTLLLQPENIQKACLDFFDDKIKLYGVKTLADNLYFLNNGRGRVSYLAIINKEEKHVNDRPYLFIEIDSKFIPEGLGYPELLLDYETKERIAYSDYSYARYYHDTLINQSGKYLYELLIPEWAKIETSNTFISHDGYNHLAFKLPDSSIILLAKKENTALSLLTYFSYLIAMFSVLLILILFAWHFRKIVPDYTLDLKNRVQISMSLVLILSLVFLGGGAIIYIKRIYNNRNTEILKEKTTSVLTELEHKMGKQEVISKEHYDFLLYYLEKFSNVFFSDINLYDLNGNLLASSRSKIFEEGLTGDKMNTLAFKKLKVDHKNFVIQEEEIGSMKYLSAYVPFMNYQNKPIAYLNLPYFAKQSEIQKEVLGFVVAVINSFVLLIIFSIAIALFIANRLTRPLSVLQEKMKAVHLGKSNEFIEWKREDEIGKLVNAYNRMISELAKSAELLAKSERESAWKEMARQVAHEIKNPLTPMKLSVQQLQKAWNDKAPDLNKRIEKFTATMIEQIDTLSSIATAFSNFAKMPIANMETLDLLKIVENTSTLYKSESNIEISIICQVEETAWVYADREQLLRVFHNLIKNACQAIPEGRKGHIIIRIESENDQYLVTVEDNGCGIAEDKKSKIFEPNFTTKSSGTGLGLAMAKNIIESFNGRISFISSIETGTTFYVYLPQYHFL